LNKIAQKLQKIHTSYTWTNPKNCTPVKACPKNAISKKAFLRHGRIYIKNADDYIGYGKCLGVFSKTISNLLKSILGVSFSDIDKREIA
jgi:hypothetical protein